MQCTGLRVVADDDRVGVPPPAMIGQEEILFFLMRSSPKKISKKMKSSPPAQRTKDQGPRTKDLGPVQYCTVPCFGTNGHPRRDTDVISRLSKSTIEDLSVDIGFTIGLLASRILDLVFARMGILEEIRT